jgi:hypothetical protein
MTTRRYRPDAGFTRRGLLRAASVGAMSLPMARLLRPADALAAGRAERIIFFNFPDGVPAWSQGGDASKWHCSGSETGFSMPECLAPLVPWREDCVFFRGLSMGGTDSGSHPGGAKKLLTAADHGNNESIDQHLSRSIGAGSPWRHLYLGAMANADNASGDKHVVYPVAGTSMAPEDDPAVAFASLFGSAAAGEGGGGSGGDTGGSGESVQGTRGSVLDAALGDLRSLQGRLGSVEKDKLDLHLESLRELEARLQGTGGGTTGGGTGAASCDDPDVDLSGVSAGSLYDPARFGDILRAQMDLMVLSMECGLTRVGTIQASHHTSELVMSRIPGTPFHDAGHDMRSHQASHYGSQHDTGSREYVAFRDQRTWWAGRLAYLLESLASRPEGGGTMLDNTLVVLCTEVCDGNTHLHDDMPFILAGGAGGAMRGGRLLDVGYKRHGDLWVSVAQAMGEDLWSFGDASSGPLSGLMG